MDMDILELAVVKCLAESRLSIDEAFELSGIGAAELMEMGLTLPQVNAVGAWLKLEAQRLVGQEQMRPQTAQELYQEGVSRKVTRGELRKMIREEKRFSFPSLGSGIGESPGPLEYKLASVIADLWESDVLNKPAEGTLPTWPNEVSRAASEIEDALLDGGVLNDLFKLLNGIEEHLHDGGYHDPSDDPV